MIKELDGVDWEKYLERKNPFLLFVVSLIAHGPMLEVRTGMGYRKQYFIHKDDVGITFSSGEEKKALPEYFLSLIKNHDKRLKDWYFKGAEQNNKADKIIEQYSNSLVELNLDNYDILMNELYETFLYGTVLPYYVLAGINILLEKHEPVGEYKEDLDYFEELRGQSRYPVLLSKVLIKYSEKAAETLKIKKEDIGLVGYLSPRELRDVLGNKSKITEEELRKRKKGCTAVFDYEARDIKVFLEYDNLSSIKDSSQIKEFEGKVANKGVVKGKVKIVNHAVDMKGFTKGDIVVSINTNPSLMPVLRECAAIVTDEGGIMCHAAIVSRELGVPCVIGTKIGTKVLKDGDIVEVDADTGVVRKIK